jgi:Fur family transcriptional regulator, stress-responsive regulator
MTVSANPNFPDPSRIDLATAVPSNGPAAAPSPPGPAALPVIAPPSATTFSAASPTAGKREWAATSWHEHARLKNLTDSRKRGKLDTVPTASDFERMLRGASLRVTAPRIAVLSAVHDRPHADTESITGVVRQNLGAVSHQAVYDVLRALTAAGLLRRIEPQGSAARYEARVGDNHHHVVCRSCGVIADVDCAIGDPPCLTASDDHGFTIDEAEVVYWGLCPDCSNPTSS